MRPRLPFLHLLLLPLCFCPAEAHFWEPVMKLTPVATFQAFFLKSFGYHHFICRELSLPLSLSVITKAPSLTNIGNSRLIAPPTPSIYLLLTRLPLFSLFDFLTVFTKMILHTHPSHSFFSLAPSSQRLRNRKTQHSSFSLFSHFFRFFFYFLHVKDKEAATEKQQIQMKSTERRKTSESLRAEVYSGAKSRF